MKSHPKKEQENACGYRRNMGRYAQPTSERHSSRYNQNRDKREKEKRKERNGSVGFLLRLYAPGWLQNIHRYPAGEEALHAYASATAFTTQLADKERPAIEEKERNLPITQSSTDLTLRPGLQQRLYLSGPAVFFSRRVTTMRRERVMGYR